VKSAGKRVSKNHGQKIHPEARVEQVHWSSRQRPPELAAPKEFCRQLQ
jgi:hypothetical protein